MVWTMIITPNDQTSLKLIWTPVNCSFQNDLQAFLKQFSRGELKNIGRIEDDWERVERRRGVEIKYLVITK